jgi:hypothetical protein
MYGLLAIRGIRRWILMLPEVAEHCCGYSGEERVCNEEVGATVVDWSRVDPVLLANQRAEIG